MELIKYYYGFNKSGFLYYRIKNVSSKEWPFALSPGRALCSSFRLPMSRCARQRRRFTGSVHLKNCPGLHVPRRWASYVVRQTLITACHVTSIFVTVLTSNVCNPIIYHAIRRGFIIVSDAVCSGTHFETVV